MATALRESPDWEVLRQGTPAAGPGLSPDVFRQAYVSMGLTPDSCPVVGVTSSIRGEGRTTAAVGLASTLSSDLGMRVLLVEVDIERPALAQRFGLPQGPGLVDALREGGHILDVMRPVTETLSVVTGGAASPETPRILHQLPRRDPFHGYNGGPEITILDLPPIMNYSYGPLAARIADAVLLVVRAGVTPSDIVREAVARLEDRPPRGVILNGARSVLPPWWPDSVR